MYILSWPVAIEIHHYVASIYFLFALIFVRRRYVNFLKSENRAFSTIKKEREREEGEEIYRHENNYSLYSPSFDFVPDVNI